QGSATFRILRAVSLTSLRVMSRARVLHDHCDHVREVIVGELIKSSLLLPPLQRRSHRTLSR
ncbi:6439_t:CDS:1, partial [Acaulospora morrowiae]